MFYQLEQGDHTDCRHELTHTIIPQLGNMQRYSYVEVSLPDLQHIQTTPYLFFFGRNNSKDVY